MEIKRTENEILIKLPLDTDFKCVPRLLDYIKFRQITAKSKATQKQIDSFTEEVKSDWNERNEDKSLN